MEDVVQQLQHYKAYKALSFTANFNHIEIEKIY